MKHRRIEKASSYKVRTVHKQMLIILPSEKAQAHRKPPWHFWISSNSSSPHFSTLPTSSPSLSFPSFIQYVDIHSHAAPYSHSISIYYIASFISSLLFHLTSYTIHIPHHLLHLALPYCEVVTQLIQLSFLPSHTVVHTQVHY